jgi:hypothetical protein
MSLFLEELIVAGWSKCYQFFIESESLLPFFLRPPLVPIPNQINLVRMFLAWQEEGALLRSDIRTRYLHL